MTNSRGPSDVTTDGLHSCSRAFKKEVGWRRHDVKQTHIAEIALAGQVHSNKMKWMNGEVRDREKVMRGLKTTDTPILTGTSYPITTFDHMKR